MRTGILGSRGFEDYLYLAECLDKHLVPINTSVSGGAKGANRLAHRYVNERRIPSEIYLPRYGQYGKSAPLKRNIQVGEASEQLIALLGNIFYDQRSQKKEYLSKLSG